MPLTMEQRQQRRATRQANKAKLAAMTPEERQAHYEARRAKRAARASRRVEKAKQQVETLEQLQEVAAKFKFRLVPIPPPPKKPKPESRVRRWSRLVGNCQEHLSALQGALEELNDLRSEFEGWRDNLPENLQQSALGEKLNTIADLDLDPGSLLSDAENAIGEAEGADLPLGFGRD